MQFVFFYRLFVFLLYPWCFNVSSGYGSLHSQGFSLPLDLGNFLLLFHLLFPPFLCARFQEFFHRYNLINFFLFFMSFFRGGEVDIKSDLILIWSIQHYRNFKINFKLHLWIWALVIFPKKLIFLSWTDSLQRVLWNFLLIFISIYLVPDFCLTWCSRSWVSKVEKRCTFTVWYNFSTSVLLIFWLDTSLLWEIVLRVSGCLVASLSCPQQMLVIPPHFDNQTWIQTLSKIPAWAKVHSFIFTSFTFCYWEHRSRRSD
jgi:hypothetical protein